MNCSKCGEDKPEEDFPKRGSKGRGSYCLVCQRSYSKRHYQETKEVRNSDRTRRRKEERLRLRQEVAELKSNPCLDCGETHPHWAMDFDHRKGEEKLFNVGYGVNRYSRGVVLREIAKCDLVCALCHRYRTYGEKRLGQCTWL